MLVSLVKMSAASNTVAPTVSPGTTRSTLLAALLPANLATRAPRPLVAPEPTPPSFLSISNCAVLANSLPPKNLTTSSKLSISELLLIQAWLLSV